MAVPLPERLENELRALTPEQMSLRVPLHVLGGEAVDVARFGQRYWAAERESESLRVIRPGLELAGAGLDQEIVADILTLQSAIQESQTEYLLALAPTRAAVATDRARFVLGEITAALEWLFDDGIEDERDTQLRHVVDAHRDDSTSQDSLAGELDDFLLLATRYREQLARIGAFEISYLDEGRTLAQMLRERTATPVTSGQLESLLERRDRLAGLLQFKINRLRAAARFVFRNHPAIAREVASSYEPNRRAEARRAAIVHGGGNEE